MARRGDNIHKRKDGRWEGRYISYYDNDGKAKYKSIYGHKYKDVKAKLENLKAETSQSLIYLNFCGSA